VPDILKALNIDIWWLQWLAATQISVVLGTVLAVILIAHILRSPRMPATSIGWIVVIIAMPLIGIPFYLAFGERKLRAKINRKQKINVCRYGASNVGPVDRILIALGLPASNNNNSVQFDADGRVAFNNVVELLGSARESIDISMFILKRDPVGRALLDVLARKAREGVKVRLLLDGVGTFSFSKRWLRAVIEAGVDVAWFIPVLHYPTRGKTNLRNHRKIVIADGHTLWTGGRNFAKTYLGPEDDPDRWIDLSYRMEGPSVAVFADIFETDWQFAHGVDVALPPEQTAEPVRQGSRVQVIPSGPDLEGDPIYAAFLTACYNARERIVIVTPYYIPDQGVQEALRLAALRGVRVDLILPEKSNHYFADVARRRFLRDLHSASVRVWLLPDHMVHAKAMVVDQDYATAGSANLDIRSLFLNCEVVSGFYSPPEIEWLADWLEGLRQKSNAYKPRPANAIKRTFEGLVLLGGYQL